MPASLLIVASSSTVVAIGSHIVPLALPGVTEIGMLATGASAASWLVLLYARQQRRATQRAIAAQLGAVEDRLAGKILGRATQIACGIPEPPKLIVINPGGTGAHNSHSSGRAPN